MKNIYWALQGLYVAAAVYIFFFSGIDRYALGPVSLLFLLIPPVAERLFAMQLGYPLKNALLLFCFLGFHLGTALRWFDRYLGFDNFVHGLSGIFFTMIGLCFFARIGLRNRNEKLLLQITYAFFFSMFVAVIWEIGEFTGYLLTGHDSQHTETTGVRDTMEDMIACFIGSLVMALDYFVYTRRSRSVCMPVVKAFDAANGYTPPAETHKK